MALSLDNEPLEITCPNCKKEIRKTVGWFKKDGQTCPHCGTGFEAKQFARDVKEAEKAIADFQRKLGDSFK